MNFLLERISDPEIEPFELAEAKRHIRQFANVTTEDDDITALIKVAREWVEDYTGRAMVDQTWRLSVTQGPLVTGDRVSGYSRPGYAGEVGWWKDNRILLRRSPALAVTRFVTVDAYNVETVVDADDYVLWDAGTKWPSVGPASGAAWTASSFRIEFRAGFADRTGSPITGAEVIPPALKHATKLILANFDANREPVNVGNIVSEMPLGIKWLLASQKCDMGFA